jgi:hypothetical protein
MANDFINQLTPGTPVGGDYLCFQDLDDLTDTFRTTCSAILAITHTHTISNVTGLQTALDGKASTSHTHLKADITDFAHTHLKADITDFAHTHIMGDITDLFPATIVRNNQNNTYGATNIQTLTKLRLVEQATPSTPPANTAELYSYDRAGRNVLRYITPGGNEFQLSQDNIIVCRNQGQGNLTKGQAVYISGSQGNDRPQIALAQANSESTMPALGILAENIDNNTDGFVIFSGTLENVDTSSFSLNDILYVSQTVAGALTTTKPTIPSNFPQVIARVLNDHATEGRLLVINTAMRGNLEGTNLNEWQIGDASAGAKTVEFNNLVKGTLTANPTGSNKTWTLPDVTGTIALTSHTHLMADITDLNPTQLVRNNQANTYTGAGTQNFGAASLTAILNLITNTANPAAAGMLRLANTDEIRWRNSGNTADLVLGLSGNTLQFAADNVVTRTISQTLTTKTINATDNIITDASTALGDLLKSNGTKFVRFAIGTGLQQIRVNAGGTDLEYFTPSGGAGDMILASVQTSTGKKTFAADATLAGFNLNNQAPSAPVAGDIWRSTDALTMRNNAGTVSLVFTKDNDASSFTAVKTFSSNPVISAITNTGTLTLPTATGTLLETGQAFSMASGIKASFTSSASSAGINLNNVNVTSGFAAGDLWRNVDTLTYRNNANNANIDISVVGHTHVLTAGATDVSISATNLNILDDGVNTTLHFHTADRARSVHTGTQALSTIDPFAISKGGTILDPAATARNIICWRAPFNCTVTNVRGYRVGGSAASINARRNGSSTHLSSNLSLATPDVWADGGAVQNTAYVAGDKLELMIISTAGSPTEVAIQVDFTRG